MEIDPIVEYFAKSYKNLKVFLVDFYFHLVTIINYLVHHIHHNVVSIALKYPTSNNVDEALSYDISPDNYTHDYNMT